MLYLVAIVDYLCRVNYSLVWNWLPNSRCFRELSTDFFNQQPLSSLIQTNLIESHMSLATLHHQKHCTCFSLLASLTNPLADSYRTLLALALLALALALLALALLALALALLALACHSANEKPISRGLDWKIWSPMNRLIVRKSCDWIDT